MAAHVSVNDSIRCGCQLSVSQARKIFTCTSIVTNSVKLIRSND